jgi:hypothetical protein
MLKDYLNKSFKKGYIKLSTSPVRYLILFVLKKDRLLRLYIDYRKLNNIIVKNRYLLLNILEL